MIEKSRPTSHDVASEPLQQREASMLPLTSPAILTTSVRPQTYQQLLHRLLTLPFGVLLLVSGLLYGASDLYKTTNNKLRYTDTVSTLIAQTASEERPTLMQSQIAYVLANLPFVDSIDFYPISLPQNLQTETNNPAFNLSTIFFEDYFTLTKPVMIADYNDPQSKQLIGYIQTTLNLKQSRKIWLLNSFPIILIVFLAFALMLMGVLSRIKKITQRLPVLERISQQLLQQYPADIVPTQLSDYVHQLDANSSAITQSPLPVWVFERALRQLMEMQYSQLVQLNQLSHKYQQLQQKNSLQLIENSNFQSTLTHEFKLALNKIQAGITLLNNQYISQEQTDALDIIKAGQRNLTAKLNQIIQLQRLEKGQVGIHLEQIDPTQLLNEIITIYAPIALQKGLNLRLQAQHTEYLLEGDRQKIFAILTAIIENAVQFTEKGQILVSSQLVNLPNIIRWQVAVTDTGVGISEKHISKIFEPFFQVNPDDNGSLAGGNSLADMDLSLAAKVTALLGGTLEVKSELGVGSTFTFTIKLNDWHKHFERRLLKDKTVAVFLQDGLFQPIIQKITRAGAVVKTYSDPILLLDELIKQPVDALLISPEVHEALLIRLTRQIRQYETKYRTLIIAYHLPQNNADREILQSIGVDYFEQYDPETQSHEQYVKRLMALLK